MGGKTSVRVSVIIPAYNSARWIERTLDSVQRQTHSDLEIIVVDDGSMDATSAIVERRALADRRIVLVRKSNGGVSSARNAGLARSTGAFLAPLDADDLWHPTKIERQLDRFADGPPRTGVVYCYYASVDEDDQVIFPRKVYHAPTGRIETHLAVANSVGNASSPLIRREELARVGGYDETFRDGCEDHDFYLRLAERCDYDLVPEFLVGYRRSRNSMSMNIPAMERAVAQVTARILGRHPEFPRRLLRWRNGNMYRYLALHARMAQKPGRWLTLSFKSVLSDPMLLCMWMIARIGKGGSPTQGADSPRRASFFDIDPRPDATERFEPTAFVARRHRATALMQTARTAAPVPAPTSR